MRLLAISNEGATFFKINEGDLEKKIAASLEQDKDFPKYQSAITGKFAPSTGSLAVIVDEIGLHFIDCMTGKETRLIVK